MAIAKGSLAAFVCLLSSAAFAGFASTEAYLPSVGRVPGKNGAQFYTTVWATNLTTAPQTFTFRFLKAGQSNPSPPSFDDTLAPGETRVYENVVESKLGLTNALGAARITSSGEIFVSERIYNQAPGDDLGNTEGLFFAGVPKSFSISAGQSASIQGVDQGSSENFRYNFALIETGGGSADVNVQVFDGSGTLLGQRSFPLSPYEQIQPSVADVVPSIATTNARITATVIDGDGSVLLAGAQVANESEDSTGFEMTFRDDLLGGGGGTAGVTSLNGLTGALTLKPGSGISITPSGSQITIAYTGGGGSGITAVTHDASLSGEGTGPSPLSIANGQVVRSVNGLHDNLTLAAGSNVTITPSGSTLTIASSGGGSGLTLPFSGSTSGSGTAFAISNTGTGDGIHGSSASTGGSGTGVYGTTHGTSGETGWAGVWGDSHDSTAVQGTSFNDRGVLGVTSTANHEVAGAEGLNRNTGGRGVLGRVANGFGGDVAGGFGVWGDAPANSAGGVLGTGVTGVVGYGSGVGLWGISTTASGIGVDGSASANTGEGGVFNGGITVTNGSKSFVEPHPTDPTKEIRYVCLEGPESGTYFRGTGHILNGFATIEVPEDFRMVSRPEGLTVQLTPVGEMAVLAAVSRSLDKIVVQGSRDVEFDYMVNGVRATVPRLQPIEENRFFVPRDAHDISLTRPLDPEVRARLVRSGILNADGSINLDTAHRLGWDKQASWKRAEEQQTPTKK